MDRVSKHDLKNKYQNEFIIRFNKKPNVIACAPGRINIIGEHTDYNKGLAMPAAINRWIFTCLSKRKDKKINIYSLNYNKRITSSIDKIHKGKSLWERYVFGAVKIILKNENISSGFDMLIAGNVQIGFGMSSSAALEVSILSGLLKIFNLNLINILSYCKEIENKILGINSGLLDQYASLHSKKGKVLLIDFSKLTHTYHKIKTNNTSWLLVNSLIKRELVNSNYNKRVKECQEGLAKINQQIKIKKDINEISKKDLSLIKSNTNLYHRLLHVIEENNRVKLMIKTLQIGNFKKAGIILNQSHKSLSKLYEVSCGEIEDIIKISHRQTGFLGGRIMGGGFGGCTINLIEKDYLMEFIKKVNEQFYIKNNYKLEFEIVEFSNGLYLY